MSTLDDAKSDLDAYLQSDPTAATPPGYTPPPTMVPAGPLANAKQDLEDALSRPSQPPPPPETWQQWGSDVAANTGASAIKGLAALPGLPHAAGQLADLEWDREMRLRGTPSPTAGQPGWLARHTYSGDELANMYLDPIGANYTPKTPAGRLYSGLVSGAASGVFGGPEGAAARMLAGGTSGLAGEAMNTYYPDAPLWQKMLVAGGAGLGTNALTAAGAYGAKQLPGLLSSSREQAEQTVVDRLRAAAGGMTGRDLVDLGDRRWQDWTTSSLPTGAGTTTLTGEAGQQLGRQVNQAQRGALAGATPANAPALLAQAQADRDAAIRAIPPGLSRQDAGEAFRQELQRIYDERQATRDAAGGAFDALKDNPARVNLQPIRDYATQMASQSAGDLGAAYQAAGRQLTSATGITLDTADFANSSRKALGDLAASYGRSGNTEAQRAVFDIKNRLDDHLADQVPEIGAAVAAWRRNSEPLDVFKAAPFGAALKRDQYDTRYLQSNDAVANAFLTGTGSADALDRLHSVFGDPEASTAALQRYIAGQVRDNAINPDGSVNLAELNKITGKYGDALMRFPTLQRQFSTAEGAQRALTQQQAYQQLYDTVEGGSTSLAPRGLGLQKTDAQGAQMLSADAVNRLVTREGGLIDQAYTPEQAAAIRRVNEELQNMAQTPQSRVAGTSGTAQTTAEAKPLGGHGPMAALSSAGGLMGAAAGSLLAHYFGYPWEAGAAAVGTGTGVIGGLVGKLREGRNNAIAQVQRQALTDPAYARKLLLKYNPDGINTPATIAAMRYVESRTPLLTNLRPFTDAQGRQAQQQQSQAPVGPTPQLAPGYKLMPAPTATQ